MDQVRFLEGLSVDSFLQLMEEPIQEKFETLLTKSRGEVSNQDQAPKLRDNLQVVVIAEFWSADVLHNLPPYLHSLNSITSG